MSTMPNLIGMNYLDATAALIAAGFVPGNVNEVKIRSGGSSQMGVVISQPIVAGATVTAGTVISLTVNKPFGQFPASDQNQPIPYWFFLQNTSTTPVVPVPPPPVVLPMLMGGNWAAGGTSQFSYENMAIFKNRVREGRGFTTTSNPWSSQVTSDTSGWPAAAHTVFLWEGGIIPGWATAATAGTPFKCGFIGSGTPTAFQFCTIANIVMGNGTTTYTTFDLYNVTGIYGFQNTAAATNIFAYLPAYPGSAIDDITSASAFTAEGLALWGKMTMVRDSWLTNAPGNASAMSASVRHTLFNTQSNKGWTTTNSEGYPKEWAMYLAKYAGIGYWPCLAAYDDGVNNSAGTYTSAILTQINAIVVPTGKPVVIELLNEVWDGTESGISGSLGARAVANGFATSTGDSQGVYQYFGYLYHQVAVMCRSIFGSNFGPGKQVQLAICNQQGGNGVSSLNIMMNYILANFGTANLDVQKYGLAPYINLTNNAGDNSTAAVIADLAAVAVVQAYNGFAEHASIVALHWGMTLCMYEGQWQVNSEATNSFISPALASTTLTAPLVSWGETCIDAGYQFPFMWFEIGCSQANGGNSPEDELSNNWAQLVSTGSPQLAAIQTLALGTYTSKRNVIANPGDSVAAGNFADLLNGTPYSLENFNNFIPSFTFGVAPFQFYCPAPRTYSLVVTMNGSGTVNVEINSVMVFTAVAVVNGPNTIGTISVKAGYNYIAIGSNGFQPITIVGPAVFN